LRIEAEKVAPADLPEERRCPWTRAELLGQQKQLQNTVFCDADHGDNRGAQEVLHFFEEGGDQSRRPPRVCPGEIAENIESIRIISQC
jgi:hypothetical protein